MQGDLEETIGIGGQRVSRRLWEAEILLRCAAFVAGIHGAAVFGLGILLRGSRTRELLLSLSTGRILGGLMLLGACALILCRRARWLVLSCVLLHLLYMLYLFATVGWLLSRNFEIDPASLLVWFLWESWELPGYLGVFLPLFVAWSVLGAYAREAFSTEQRGAPLAPISSLLRNGASVRGWAGVGLVLLSLIHASLMILSL